MLASLALTVALATAVVGERPSLAQTYALIIGNNQSLGLRRPSLQYADDDAVKYAELLGSLMPARNILLLSELDRDTERLHPQQAKQAHQPTRANVEAALDELAARAREDQEQGAQVSFYFIFAGHGDVDEGRGFLELKDGAFTADDLERALQRMPAAQSHVILDSCNSFFVINPRKPGGKRFATAKDAMESLARRLPTVGVFLSTSAEAEVYEWSELQSGIFSHTVRSGLAGAADANRDGHISYAELSGFVELAAREVRNPLFRPRVFARGPGGDNRRALLELGSAQAVLLEAGGGGPVRLTVRDADGGRWLDANVEAGSTVSLRLPTALVQGMSVEQPTEQGEWRANLASGSRTVALASLSPWRASERARGPGDLLRALFSTPFGPRALAALEQERTTQPEPVYGISQEDFSRMSLLLGSLADIERGKRMGLAGATLGAGIIVMVGGGLFFGQGNQDADSLGLAYDTRQALQWGVAGLGLAGVVAGSIGMIRLSEGERLSRHFQQQVSSSGYDPAQLVASTESQLQMLLEQERSGRRTFQTILWTAIGLNTAGLLANELLETSHPDSKAYIRYVGTSTLAIGAGLLFASYFEKSSTEHVIRIWQGDPSIKRLPRMSIHPLDGGGMLSLRGEF
ncbi:caspase domain-containing protein [Cystobacter fuscus]|uniref:caspase domain-containing protein n=1 Tax=Cystobacter fuscus TaxID=43 RepID=UPI0037BF69A7